MDGPCVSFIVLVEFGERRKEKGEVDSWAKKGRSREQRGMAGKNRMAPLKPGELSMSYYV